MNFPEDWHKSSCALLLRKLCIWQYFVKCRYALIIYIRVLKHWYSMMAHWVWKISKFFFWFKEKIRFPLGLRHESSCVLPLKKKRIWQVFIKCTLALIIYNRSENIDQYLSVQRINKNLPINNDFANFEKNTILSHCRVFYCKKKPVRFPLHICR